MSTPPLRISIASYNFQISAPYSAGPATVTADEARAFNLLRAKTIRNRITPKIMQAVSASPNGRLSPCTIADFQFEISTLDSTFQFSHRQRAPKTTALDIEIEIVAAEMADSAARQLGDFEASEEMIEEWKQKPEVQVEAQRRLSEQRKALEGEEL